MCVCVDEKFSLSRNADKKDAAARDRSLKKRAAGKGTEKAKKYSHNPSFVKNVFFATYAPLGAY